MNEIGGGGSEYPISNKEFPMNKERPCWLRRSDLQILDGMQGLFLMPNSLLNSREAKAKPALNIGHSLLVIGY